MDLKKFGMFISIIREKSGFKSQRQLAIESGISNGTIARIESGTQKPQPETLKILAKYLKDVTYEDLLTKAGYLTEQEKDFIDDLSMTDKDLIEKYKDKIEIEGKPATEDELKKAIDYIKFLRFSAK